jgi:hypothetical protein
MACSGTAVVWPLGILPVAAAAVVAMQQNIRAKEIGKLTLEQAAKTKALRRVR